MTQLEPTRDPRPIWQTVALVMGVGFLLGFWLLPRVDPAAARLRGSEAPEFVLPIIYGGDRTGRIRLSDLRGKSVLLDFWASWCGTCRKQAPILDRVARRHADRVAVLGVIAGDRPEHAAEFASMHRLSYPSVFDADGSVAQSYGASALPTLVLVSPEGRIVEVRQGLVQAEELERLLGPTLSR